MHCLSTKKIRFFLFFLFFRTLLSMGKYLSSILAGRFRQEDLSRTRLVQSQARLWNGIPGRSTVKTTGASEGLDMTRRRRRLVATRYYKLGTVQCVGRSFDGGALVSCGQLGTETGRRRVMALCCWASPDRAVGGLLWSHRSGCRLPRRDRNRGRASHGAHSPHPVSDAITISSFLPHVSHLAFT